MLTLGAALRAFHVLDGSHKLAHGVNSLGTLGSALQIATLLRVTQELYPFDCIIENLHQMLEFLCRFIRPVDSFRQNPVKSPHINFLYTPCCVQEASNGRFDTYSSFGPQSQLQNTNRLLGFEMMIGCRLSRYHFTSLTTWKRMERDKGT